MKCNVHEHCECSWLAGDLARWLLNGNIEFLGRLDDQVKLRGFRIELGEVEAVLMEAPGVKLAAAIVMKDPSATDRLVGFVSPDSVASEAILAELKQRLPAHFVPSLIVPLAEMPLSPAGKVCLFTHCPTFAPRRQRGILSLTLWCLSVKIVYRRNALSAYRLAW